MSVKLKGPPVERQTLAAQVYSSVKQAILEGELRPGERLKELEIAESLGASRTPVREALSRLEQEGLVKPLKSGGLTVVELSERDVVEIFGLIRVLEAYAARLAAERVTAKHIDKLDALCAQAEQLAEDYADRLVDLNRRFHEAFIEGADHGRLQDLLTNLRLAMQPYRIVSLASPEFRKTSVTDHRRIVEALRAGDVHRLVQLVTDHLGVAQQVALAGIREQARRLAADAG